MEEERKDREKKIGERCSFVLFFAGKMDDITVAKREQISSDESGKVLI